MAGRGSRRAARRQPCMYRRGGYGVRRLDAALASRGLPAIAAGDGGSGRRARRCNHRWTDRGLRPQPKSAVGRRQSAVKSIVLVFDSLACSFILSVLAFSAPSAPSAASAWDSCGGSRGEGRGRVEGSRRHGSSGAPKGRDRIAQGTALGTRGAPPSSPERARSPAPARADAAPTGLAPSTRPVPRALPWATRCQPFGLKRRHPSPIRAHSCSFVACLASSSHPCSSVFICGSELLVPGCGFLASGFRPSPLDSSSLLPLLPSA